MPPAGFEPTILASERLQDSRLRPRGHHDWQSRMYLPENELCDLNRPDAFENVARDESEQLNGNLRRHISITNGRWGPGITTVFFFHSCHIWKNLKTVRKTRIIFPVYVWFDVESPASCLGRLTIILMLVVLNYVVNTHEWVEVQRFSFGIKWVSVSYSGRFIPHEINPCTNWIWVNLVTRSCKCTANRQSTSYRQSNTGFSVLQRVVNHYTDWATKLTKNSPQVRKT